VSLESVFPAISPFYVLENVLLVVGRKEITTNQTSPVKEINNATAQNALKEGDLSSKGNIKFIGKQSVYSRSPLKLEN